MTSLADENEFVRMCLYGRYGTAKTTSLAHGAHLGHTILVDAEKRLKGGPLRRLGVPVERIEPFREITYEALDQLIWDVKGRLHDDPTSVACLGFDGVDEMVKVFVREVLNRNVARSLKRAAKSGEEASVNRFQIDLDYWGEMSEQLGRILRHTRDLECHLMFTSHERRDIDGDGEVTYGPAATPAVQSDLMGYVDVLGHTKLHLGWYVAEFKPSGKFQAKDTFGVLPATLANPTMDRVVGYVNGSLTVETDPVQQKYLEAVRADMDEMTTSVLAEGEGGGRRRRGRS